MSDDDHDNLSAKQISGNQLLGFHDCHGALPKKLSDHCANSLVASFQRRWIGVDRLALGYLLTGKDAAVVRDADPELRNPDLGKTTLWIDPMDSPVYTIPSVETHRRPSQK